MSLNVAVGVSSQQAPVVSDQCLVSVATPFRFRGSPPGAWDHHPCPSARNRVKRSGYCVSNKFGYENSCCYTANRPLSAIQYNASGASDSGCAVLGTAELSFDSPEATCTPCLTCPPLIRCFARRSSPHFQLGRGLAKAIEMLRSPISHSNRMVSVRSEFDRKRT